MRTTNRDRTATRGLYAIKPLFVRALEPTVRYAESHDVAPSAVTAAAIPVEVATVSMLILGTMFPVALLLVPALALVWITLNAIDGALARSTGRTTIRGAALNELVDRLGDLLLIGTAFLIAPVPIGALMAVGVLTSELASALEWAITGRRVFVGPMGKPDRVAIVAVGAVLTLVWGPALVAAFTVVGIASCIGAIVRARHLLGTAAAQDEGSSA
jgi:phosphatidylglycerophosphate synthase